MYKIIPLPNQNELKNLLTRIIRRNFPAALAKVLYLTPIFSSKEFVKQLIGFHAFYL